MSQVSKDEILGKGILSLLIITGVGFSVLTFLMLDENAQAVISVPEVKSKSLQVCENGLCYTENSKKEFNNLLVQLEADVSNTSHISQNEDFTNLKLVKSKPVKGFEKSGNKITLYAEKDSFIREGIVNTNEGSNEFLRILGAGPINNRALISFNLDEIQELNSGKPLESATIKLHVEKNNHQWGDGQFISIHSMLVPWDEGNGVNAPISNLIRSDGVTWNCPVNTQNCETGWNGGVFEQLSTDSIWISNQVDDYWIKFDVTSDILDYQKTKQNFGWIIIKEDENSNGQINLASREAKSNNPELVLVFSNE